MTDQAHGDEAAAQLRRLHVANGQLVDALKTVMQLDLRGHKLVDRLQFSTAGRQLLSVVDAAFAAAEEANT